MSLLEQDNTRKERLYKIATELDVGNHDSEKYKVEVIPDSTVYARESESSHLPGLQYLFLWKNYLEEKNT